MLNVRASPPSPSSFSLFLKKNIFSLFSCSLFSLLGFHSLFIHVLFFLFFSFWWIRVWLLSFVHSNIFTPILIVCFQSPHYTHALRCAVFSLSNPSLPPCFPEPSLLFLHVHRVWSHDFKCFVGILSLSLLRHKSFLTRFPVYRSFLFFAIICLAGLCQK